MWFGYITGVSAGHSMHELYSQYSNPTHLKNPSNR